MKLLVCGPRDFTDRAFVISTLDDWLMAQPDLGVTVIHGGATGVDTFAGEWARATLCTEIVCPADWAKYGKAAGPIRNQQMLTEHDPDQVIAFAYPSRRITPGTQSMAHLACDAGKSVRLVRNMPGQRITDKPFTPIPVDPERYM